MRTTRIILLCIFVSATLFALVRSLSRGPSPNKSHRSTAEPQRSFFGFIYYNTPFSLFPPNAAISLTDDNSTSFAARPAAFGPRLASTGLSGPLWVGSGFADDNMDGIGELGCSDIPEWEAGRTIVPIDSSAIDELGSTGDPDRPHRAHDLTGDARDDAYTPKTKPYTDVDDTDDYLHGSFSKNSRAQRASPSTQGNAKPRKSAEIQGKVVLLMRGGCGFLEKVMWAQRRGAIAVIVGDNQRGGPLIQMFARGDETENVTIPSVFTARTTAQLLSSLTQPGSFIDNAIDDSKRVLRLRRGLLATKRTQVLTRVPQGEQPKRWLSGLLARSKTDSSHLKAKASSSNKNNLVDEFIIGVQDWRDPGLLAKTGSKDNAAIMDSAATDVNSGTSDSSEEVEAEANLSIWHKIFGHSSVDVSTSTANMINDAEEDFDDGATTPHEALWVTIIPTSGATPFFDTLLVLVVSPLVTLTVVYSLLVLRARIRRRRWRAPKSVVDRLPVRTYHTVAISPSLSSRAPSPSGATPTTPLLQRSESSSRPRSQTTTGTTENPGFLAASASIPTPAGPSRTRGREEHEKGASGFSAEWRKYMGRQVECVVCLEEYVDGVSRVMSLPCGHEFHADCITPWLTTRRRTCPICKGDVVRSLARGSPSIPRYDPYIEDSDDIEEAGSQSPVNDIDVEQGIIHRNNGRSPVAGSHENWLGILSGFGADRPTAATASSSSRPASLTADNERQ